MEHDNELDARGMSCPLPIVKTKKMLNSMEPGKVLKVIATDLGAVNDMAAFAEQTGNPLLESTQQGGEYCFYLRKG